MNRKLNIFILAVALLGTQACGSKSETKENEESAVMEATATNADVEVIRAKERARLQKDIDEWDAKRNLAIEKLAKVTPTYLDADGNVIYNKAEVQPMFGNGKYALSNYMKENLVYPEVAKDKGLEGTVFVDFIVAANGSIREVAVTEASSDEVNQLFSNEAIRVVTAMPKWTPGLQHEKPVDVKFSLPISFQLD